MRLPGLRAPVEHSVALQLQSVPDERLNLRYLMRLSKCNEGLRYLKSERLNLGLNLGYLECDEGRVRDGGANSSFPHPQIRLMQQRGLAKTVHHSAVKGTLGGGGV